jgi:RNA polymerase sigma factor (sigma-70 family)
MSWLEKLAAIKANKEPVLERLDARAAQRDREMQLWRRWKDSGQTDQQALGDLFQSLAPLIRKVSLNYTGNLPPAAVEGWTKQQVLAALKTYDPNRGTQLNTHIMTQTQKVLREVYRYQNPTRIAEESHLRVPAFQNVQANLQSQLGRPPTSLEIAREMGVGVSEVERLRAGARRDLGAIEGGMTWKREGKEKEREILALICYELTPQEQQVLELTFGMNGKPEMKQAKQIAAKLGITQARVSQIKKRISEVLTYHYGGHKIPDVGD